jgi:hypothetical protein
MKKLVFTVATLISTASILAQTAQFSTLNLQPQLAFAQTSITAPIIQVDQRFQSTGSDERRKYEKQRITGNLIMIGGITTVGVGLIVPPMKVLNNLNPEELGPMAKKMVVSSVIGGIAYGVGAVMVKNADAHLLQLKSTSSGIGLELIIPYQKQKSINNFDMNGK